jgi:pimeloyl-[acyl-carrier protein] synthase
MSGPLDFLAPEHRDDPYPVMAALREREPVAHAGGGLWVLSRYADCRLALLEARFSSDMRNAADYDASAPLAQAAAALMVYNDPPDHTRLRGLVQKAFTPRRVAEMRPRIEAIVGELLGGDGELEVIGDLAHPLPFIVIAELLGVPAVDHDRFRVWAGDLALVLEPVQGDERRQRAMAASVELGAYLQPQFAERRARPRDDLLTALVQAEEAGDRLSESELGANVVQLLIAGHETTQNLIANGLWALLRNPDQLDRLRDDPALVPTAVEELLRYDSPVQFAARVAREDIALDGATIPRGARVMVLLGAANRDPARFTNPDALDVGRDDGPHVAFGHGPHFCLGNALARLEGAVALRALTALPGLRLAGGPPSYRDTAMLRGLRELRVRCG